MGEFCGKFLSLSLCVYCVFVLFIVCCCVCFSFGLEVWNFVREYIRFLCSEDVYDMVWVRVDEC